MSRRFMVARSKQVTPSKNATGRRADGRTDESTLQAGIVAVTSVAFNRGAQISAGEEPARGSNDCPEELPPEASFRPRVPSVLRAQHPGRSAAGRKSCGRQPGRALLNRGVGLGQREQKRTGCRRRVVNADHLLAVSPCRREGRPQHKRNNGWVSKTVHPANRCIDRAACPSRSVELCPTLIDPPGSKCSRLDP